MPQGLPKKIQVGLLLPDLALELGDPTPCRCSLIEDRTPQRRTIQRPLARPTGPPQRLQPALADLLLPLVYPLAVDPKIRRNRRRRLTGGYSLDCSSLDLRRDYLWTLHQFLSSRETVRILSVSLLGCTPEPQKVQQLQKLEKPQQKRHRMDAFGFGQ
jgi:hypothetical protein